MGSFDEEWAALQAAAREQSTPTRLNSSEGGGAGARDRLVVSWTAQRAAADVVEREVLPDAVRAGTKPLGELAEAAARMRTWASAAGLRAVAESWATKTEALGTQLRAEAEALRATASGFQGGDLEITYQLRSIDGTE
ncbi:hypothetical protein [Streptomyces sp. NBC_01803]|uniref:hypothetical protein n=1 Tax=Streptomyces sp. NBC_01803 TaxID=2975946 RepID=UPI002DDA23F7|nr:hypothetical protein [Streptomyces sp. NBC_01803]WSA46792.1 hypothetical protein OIE51_22970 [Streptomyces sp. NBC_01803]